MMKIETAHDVIKYLQRINIKKDSTAENPVLRRRIGKREVFNLTVENNHEYYADGFLVSNCMDALRYALFTHLFGKTSPGMTAQERDNLYNEAMGMGNELPAAFQQPMPGRY